MKRMLSTVMVLALAACGPHVVLPPVPATLANQSDSADIALAKSLAPLLHVQRDEPFRLERVVAVVNPARPIVAYHLLWSHDINGQWVPWAKASDAEEVWVGYDPVTRHPTAMWTYWHGDILHTSWVGKGQPAVAVQWGKHGSLPYGVVESDLPRSRTLNLFYAAEFVLLPDIWLGKASHGGPWGFFHSYRRYRDFSRIVDLPSRLDAVVTTEDPRQVLRDVFGPRHADKRPWPARDPHPR
ncbi:MAG TPA: hypothetical protein VIC03_06320 [Gemmatimonadaceae bacterium]|jgi:hypothetical protein